MEGFAGKQRFGGLGEGLLHASTEWHSWSGDGFGRSEGASQGRAGRGGKGSSGETRPSRLGWGWIGVKLGSMSWFPQL